MKWTVKLIAETGPGESVEHEVASIERAEVVSPATVGLTIAEGKTILESLQKQMVMAQIQHHGASILACTQCGRLFRTKGYYRCTLRSVYGNVRIRVRWSESDSSAGGAPGGARAGLVPHRDEIHPSHTARKRHKRSY